MSAKQEVERREEPDLNKIWELLHEINLKLAVHMKEEEEIRPKLLELIEILITSKGILRFVKYVAGISAGLLALHTFFGKYVTWIK